MVGESFRSSRSSNCTGQVVVATSHTPRYLCSICSLAESISEGIDPGSLSRLRRASIQGPGVGRQPARGDSCGASDFKGSKLMLNLFRSRSESSRRSPRSAPLGALIAWDPRNPSALSATDSNQRCRRFDTCTLRRSMVCSHNFPLPPLHAWSFPMGQG